MTGDEVLQEISRRIALEEDTARVTDVRIAARLGLTANALTGYKGKDLTPKQVINLMESYANAASKRLIENAVDPIVEFMPIFPTQTTQKKVGEFSQLRRMVNRIDI